MTVDADAVVMGLAINRNMGCIEIVLAVFGFYSTLLINRNMGCIEIRVPDFHSNEKFTINRNMRCIEMILE